MATCGHKKNPGSMRQADGSPGKTSNLRPAWISDSPSPGPGDEARLQKQGPSSPPGDDDHGKRIHSFTLLEIFRALAEIKATVLLYSYLKEGGDCAHFPATHRPFKDRHHSQASVSAPGSILRPWIWDVLGIFRRLVSLSIHAPLTLLLFFSF